MSKQFPIALFAIVRVGHSLACPFDLQSLVPMPTDVLGLGPDDPSRAGLALDALGHGAGAAPCYVGQPCLPPDDAAAPAPAEALRGATLHSSDRDHHTTQSANQYLDERSVVSVVNEPSALGSCAAW
jgi:hypothetical protein